ncbi:myosin regulatory light polypeptide 9-like protein [Backusella circina FSU 941]|nr:myosin regulatory light polypeptide 9-like protein [Backusella circina FSU 941]
MFLCGVLNKEKKYRARPLLVKMVSINKRRQNSNVFEMFDKAQVMEFKDAFNIMDTNNDGIIDENDLQLTFEKLGDINFTVFLTLMADKLSNTDKESKIIKAFLAFDENKNGTINASYLRDCIIRMGDKFTEEEADFLFKDFVNDETGDFYYRDFVRVLKRGE